MPDLWTVPNSRIEAAAEAFKGDGWRVIGCTRPSGLWAWVRMRNDTLDALTTVTVYADTYHCKEH